MSPIRPTQHAIELVCPKCGKKPAGVVVYKDGSLQYWPSIAFFERKVSSSTPPALRVFDVTGPSRREFKDGFSLGRSEIVCKCGWSQIFKDDRIKRLVETDATFPKGRNPRLVLPDGS